MRVGERREPSPPTLLSMCAQTAEEAYAAAAKPEIAGQVLSTSNQYGLQEGSREAILEEIFVANVRCARSVTTVRHFTCSENVQSTGCCTDV